MGTVTNGRSASSNLSTATLMSTLYTSANLFSHGKFVTFRGGNSNLAEALGKSLTGLEKAECSNGDSNQTEDKYDRSNTTCTAYLALSGGSLHFYTTGDADTSELLIDSSVIDIENLLFSSTWAYAELQGDDSRDDSTMVQGAVYDCATEAVDSNKWAVWAEAYGGDEDYNTDYAEAVIDVTLTVSSKRTGAVITSLTFRLRAYAKSEK